MDLGMSAMFQGWGSSPKPQSPSSSARTAKVQAEVQRFNNELSDIDSYFGSDTGSLSNQKPQKDSSLFGLGSIVGAIGDAIGAIENTIIDTRPSQEHPHHSIATITDRYDDDDEDSNFSDETSSGTSENVYEYQSDSSASEARAKSKSKSVKFSDNSGNSKIKRRHRRKQKVNSESGFTRVEESDLDQLTTTTTSDSRSTVQSSSSLSSSSNSSINGKNNAYKGEPDEANIYVDMLQNTVLLGGLLPPIARIESIYEIIRACSDEAPDGFTIQLVRISDPLPVELKAQALLYDVCGPKQSSQPFGDESPPQHQRRSADPATAISKKSTPPLPALNVSQRGSAVTDSVGRSLRSHSDDLSVSSADTNMFISDSEDEAVRQRFASREASTTVIAQSRSGGIYTPTKSGGLDSLRQQLEQLEHVNRRLSDEIDFLVSSPIVMQASKGIGMSNTSSRQNSPRSRSASKMIGRSSSQVLAIAVRLLGDADHSSVVASPSASEVAMDAIIRRRRSVINIFPDVNLDTMNAYKAEAEAEAAAAQTRFTVMLKSVRSSIHSSGEGLQYFYDVGIKPSEFDNINSNRDLLFKAVSFCISAINSILSPSTPAKLQSRKDSLPSSSATTESIPSIDHYFVGSPLGALRSSPQRPPRTSGSNDEDDAMLLNHIDDLVLQLSKEGQHISPRGSLASSPRSRNGSVDANANAHSNSGAHPRRPTRKFSDTMDELTDSEDEDWHDLQQRLNETNQELQRKLSSISSPFK